jgi:hypothetical protein
MEYGSERHCGERSDEAIQLALGLRRLRLDFFASPATTATGSDGVHA